MADQPDQPEANQEVSGLSEINIEVKEGEVAAWKSIISPLIAFETEYDLKVIDSVTKNSDPSFLFAKAATNSQGKDCQLLTCSTQSSV